MTGVAAVTASQSAADAAATPVLPAHVPAPVREAVESFVATMNADEPIAVVRYAGTAADPTVTVEVKPSQRWYSLDINDMAAQAGRDSGVGVFLKTMDAGKRFYGFGPGTALRNAGYAVVYSPSRDGVSNSVRARRQTILVSDGPYTYERSPDGTIRIVSGPTGAGSTHKPGSRWHQQMNRAIEEAVRLGEYRLASAETAAVGYVLPRPGAGPDDLGTYGRFFTYGRGRNFQYPL